MKKKPADILKWLILSLAASALLSGCSGRWATQSRTDLFELPLGVMEEDFDFFFISGNRNPYMIDMVCENGIFYLANQSSSRIQKFSSYGDLLTFLYNPEKTPAPVLLPSFPSDAQSSEEEAEVNRSAREFPFESVGHLGVTENYIFVEDKVSTERQRQDASEEILYSWLVHRFDKNGRYDDFIGQEGIGGGPFPFIQDIKTTRNNEVVVVCRTAEYSVIYWYNEEGYLLYNVRIYYSGLPSSMDENYSSPKLESLQCDMNEHKIYLFISHQLEDEKNRKEGTPLIQNSLYEFSLEQEADYQFVSNLPYQEVTVGGEEMEINYEFLGAIEGGYLAFIGLEDLFSYRLFILDQEGNTVKKRILDLMDLDVITLKFYLGQNGILSALVVSEDKARTFWWRLDQILD